MSNYKFKNDYKNMINSKEMFEQNIKEFEMEIINFFMKYNIPVRFVWFGEKFGVDIKVWKSPLDNIPIDVLYEFCKEFGCSFKGTTCNYERYIFYYEE